MDDNFSPTFLKARISNQKARAKLTGDSPSFLASKAKKDNKRERDHFISGMMPKGPKTVLPSSDITPKVSDAPVKKYGLENTDTHSPIYTFSTDTLWLNGQSKKKKKKKEEKRQKKRKKNREKMGYTLDGILDERELKSANVMAEIFKNTYYVVSYEDELWVYSEDDGSFHKSPCSEIAKELRESLNEDSLLKLSSREYKEAYDLLRISKEISHETGFFANAPFINCRNGVVDVMSGELLPHSPDFLFRQTINANYDPDSRCDKFLEYVDFVTGNNDELKRLLRTIIGYICSHYVNAKTAFLIYGIPHTGKSVLCNVISRIIGKEYVSHVDLSMLHKQEYAASLSGKLVNIAPDLRNEPIVEVGFFKSLVSHDDTICTRPLYGNPRPLKCETKMIFSSNHLLEMDSKMGIFDIEAVFNRLLYLPYQNLPITSEQDNKHLSDEIYLEKDGVFTWAVKGLREYIELGENFPRSSLSDEIKAKNVAMYCPEKIFFSECLKVEEGRHESSAAIKAAFEAYCLEVGAKNRGNISNYLEEHEKLKKAKKRVDSKGYTKSDGNPIHVYENVHIKKKYRYLLGEDKKESFDDKE